MPIASDILAPIAAAMRYLPVTAFYPLLIMWFGIDESMKVAFLFIATFVYMMPSVLLCLDEINPDLINTAKFDDPAAASATLDEFIETAKILDGTIIEIAGNTDPNPISDPDDTANILLSQQRAETVKQYFILNGIDPNRIVTVGNGSSNPMYDNDTEEHRALNRRTDVSFKIIESN